MSRSNYPLRLQTSPLSEVRRLAEAEGASINQFINVAVAGKLSALRTEGYFRERAARADVPAALALLERLGTEPPRPGDDEVEAPAGHDDRGLRLAKDGPRTRRIPQRRKA
ncbi:MAG TPA: hypothetical protein VFG47_05310 [Geminicoccaceae bacterium]|nr:hypothetical protein [Geminicoccaceae bacterium]